MSKLVIDKLGYEEITREGARLIDEYLYDEADNVLYWSPKNSNWVIPANTALVYGDKCGPANKRECFQARVRHILKEIGAKELCCVEYYEGGDAFWAMLVEAAPYIDLQVAVRLCSKYEATIKSFIKMAPYAKYRIDGLLKLLVPDYPRCDLKQRLNTFILPRADESCGTCSSRLRNEGGRCDG